MSDLNEQYFGKFLDGFDPEESKALMDLTRQMFTTAKNSGKMTKVIFELQLKGKDGGGIDAKLITEQKISKRVKSLGEIVISNSNQITFLDDEGDGKNMVDPLSAQSEAENAPHH